MNATARPQGLADVEQALWQELGRAAQTRGHAWRTPVLATREGDIADARILVLREVRTEHRELLFYSDARAGKLVQVAQAPVGTLVMWSADLGWQLRCRVHLGFETGGLEASSRWARLQLSPAAQDYLSPLPPGSPLDAPVPALQGRSHFAVVTARVLSMDWLELHPQGHRRARLDDQGARWLQP
jgi:pyridoxamine 5'-phosphate oxidase